MKQRISAIVPLLVLAASSAASATAYVSPDKKLVAEVIGAGPANEHRIEVRDLKHKILAAADYSSEDGEHGQIVDRAQWSADSLFFVFSTENSGGHQSWSSGTYFFSRVDQALHNLRDFLSPIADPNFQLAAPDRLTVAVWTPFTHGIDDSVVLRITFSLRELMRARVEAHKGAL